MKLLTASLAFLLAGHLSAATFYVDSATGSDSNTSTQAKSQTTPWKHAPGMSGATGNVSSYSVQSGDIFVLKGGSTWTPANTTDYLYTVPASGITISGGQLLATPWGSGYPVLDGTGSTATRAGVYAYGKSNVTINGIEIYGTCHLTDASGNGMDIEGAASSWEVENCLFDGCGVNWLVFAPSSGSKFLVHDNAEQNCGRLNVLIAKGVSYDDIELYSNTVLGIGTYNCLGYHCDGFMIGADTEADPSTLTNVLIHHNKFYGQWLGPSTLSVGATALIYLNDGAGGPNVTVGGGYHCQIYDNQLCLDSNGFLSPGFIFIDNGWRDVQIYNNTMSAIATGTNVQGGNTIPGGISIANVTTSAAIVIKNNIITGCDTAIAANGTALTASTGLTIDYNIFQTNGNNHYLWDANNRYDTLAALQAQGYEAHGIVGDPKFTTLPNGTTGHGAWTLQVGSPAIGAGLPINSLFTTDVLGKARGSSWDIGAYQYGSGISVPSITSALTATGTVGSSFSYAISASNSPTTYSASGLPAGLSVNASSGLISGTPTTAGATSVTIGATNTGGTGTATLVITIAVLPPSSATTAISVQ